MECRTVATVGGMELGGVVDWSIGKVKIERFNGEIPFYSISYHENLKRFDEKHCGGNCFDFLNEHFYMVWV